MAQEPTLVNYHVVCCRNRFFIYSFWAKIDHQFFLKLSVSVPVAFAVWFSSLQYNKERKIVEEYAFKSATSKSLSGFNKVVNEINPQGGEKTQAFLIDSIFRIFEPPDLTQKEEYPLEKVVKRAKDIIKEMPK